MDSYNRVKKTIEFDQPDRLPVIHAVLPAAWMRHGQKLYSIIKDYPLYLSDYARSGRAGQSSAGYEINAEYGEKFLLNDDFIFTEPRSYQYGKPCESGFQSDEWGCLWQKKDPGIVGQVILHPLEENNSFKNYRFPDAKAYWRYDNYQLYQLKKEAGKNKKYFLAYIGNLFELLQWLLGFENLMVMFYKDALKVFEIIEKITAYNIDTMKEFCKYGINGVVMNDDWVTQKSLMINPGLWKKFFKPAYKRIADAAIENKIHFHFHTDGNTIEIIDDLIGIGVDVINPQFSSMDIEMLAKSCRGKVCIKTDIDRQYILPKATVKEVRDYVKYIIKKFSTDKGGLILCGELNSDVKLENVRAMYESFEKYGKID